MENIGSLIVQALFSFVSTLSTAILYPVVHAIFSLFPDLLSPFAYAVGWFEQAFTYLTCVYNWFLFDHTMFLLLFDYFAVKFLIFTTGCAIRFALRVYNLLKI